MSWEQIAIALAGPLVALALGTWTIVQTRRKASSEQLGKIEAKVEHKADAAIVTVLVERLDEVRHRVTRVEDEIEHMPDRETTHRLELSISEMRGEMKTLAERMKPVAAISERLQEVLLEQGHR